MGRREMKQMIFNKKQRIVTRFIVPVIFYVIGFYLMSGYCVPLLTGIGVVVLAAIGGIIQFSK